MQDSRFSNVARMSAERSTPARLDEVLRWLVQHQGAAMRLDAEEVPALGATRGCALHTRSLRRVPFCARCGSSTMSSPAHAWWRDIFGSSHTLRALW